MNVLILSCGTRNKVVQYFKEQWPGQVFAADCSEFAPALYEADDYFLVPKMDDAHYIDILLSICEANDVQVVLSLIDPELSLLAKNRARFLAIGVTPLVADLEAVELCLDKFALAQRLTACGVATVPSFVDAEQIAQALADGTLHYPLFSKPVKGSASKEARKVEHAEELHFRDGLVVQPFMDGEEYGVDVYVDTVTHEVVALFAKHKLAMRAGETDKAVSVVDAALFDVVTWAVRAVGVVGVVDVDVFCVGGQYIVSEINPRFGGGYPHAHACGVQFPSLIARNMRGEANAAQIGHYEAGIGMMKYSEVHVQPCIR